MPEGNGRTGRGAGASPLIPGALLLFFVAALAWLPGMSRTPWPAMALWAGAFGSYLAAAAWQARRPIGRGQIWALAILGRLSVWPREPRLSDDIHRYLWDGWVQANGINPFRYAPADPALEALRTDWHSLINHPAISTIYPPGAQLGFWILALVGPTVLLFKAAWILADLGVGLTLERLAARRDGTAGLAPLLYLWSPLVLIEVAWSGHMEPLGILSMMAAILVLDHARTRYAAAAGGALLGFGGAIKLAPLAALPAAGRKRPVAAAIALAAVIALSLPYLGAGTKLFGGLVTYAEHWEFNAGLFRLLAVVFGPDGARATGAVCIIGSALWATWHSWKIERTLYWLLGIALLLSPTIHPWYVLWILPLAALRGGRAWLALSGTVFLAYWGLDAFQATGIWPEPGWLPFLIHAPVLVLLALDAAGAQRPPAAREVPRGKQAGEESGRDEPARREGGDRSGQQDS